MPFKPPNHIDDIIANAESFSAIIPAASHQHGITRKRLKWFKQKWKS